MMMLLCAFVGRWVLITAEAEHVFGQIPAGRWSWFGHAMIRFAAPIGISDRLVCLVFLIVSPFK